MGCDSSSLFTKLVDGNQCNNGHGLRNASSIVENGINSAQTVQGAATAPRWETRLDREVEDEDR